MSDLIRGTPIGQQSTNQVYQAPPSAMSQIAGLGLTAASAYGMMKAEGGMISEKEARNYNEGHGIANLGLYNAMNK
jgi:hypothetical protein